MATAAEVFLDALGAPAPAAPFGVPFQRAASKSLWEELAIPAGWYRDGFLYLFGEGLEALHACLDAWSFLVPPNPQRLVLGRNAYGALLTLENEARAGAERVYLLDPFTVTYGEVPQTRLASLIGRVLPGAELPTFLDDRAYRAWREHNRVNRLDAGDVLGIKVPRALGGELTADNLQLDDIVGYYQTTAPIYADAFARLPARG